jgi:hypothetical protein
MRACGGAWDGKTISSRLSHSRVLGVLKNPSYAGMYVFAVTTIAARSGSTAKFLSECRRRRGPAPGGGCWLKRRRARQ